MITVKIKNNSTAWNKYLRIRVNDVVVIDGNYFQNTSGINSNPLEDNADWNYIGTEKSFKNNKLFTISKGNGNVLETIQAGDIVCGMLDDNSTFIPFGKYIGDVNGGGVQNVQNYITNPISF